MSEQLVSSVTTVLLCYRRRVHYRCAGFAQRGLATGVISAGGSAFSQSLGNSSFACLTGGGGSLGSFSDLGAAE